MYVQAAGTGAGWVAPPMRGCRRSRRLTNWCATPGRRGWSPGCAARRNLPCIGSRSGGAVPPGVHGISVSCARRRIRTGLRAPSIHVTLRTPSVPGSVWTRHSLATLRALPKTARIMLISANHYGATAPAVSRADSPDHEPAADRCACGHPRNQHDSISSRYCDATASAGLDRGCVCRAAPGAYPGRM